MSAVTILLEGVCVSTIHGRRTPRNDLLVLSQEGPSCFTNAESNISGGLYAQTHLSAASGQRTETLATIHSAGLAAGDFGGDRRV